MSEWTFSSGIVVLVPVFFTTNSQHLSIGIKDPLEGSTSSLSAGILFLYRWLQSEDEKPLRHVITEARTAGGEALQICNSWGHR